MKKKIECVFLTLDLIDHTRINDEHPEGNPLHIMICELLELTEIRSHVSKHLTSWTHLSEANNPREYQEEREER